MISSHCLKVYSSWENLVGPTDGAEFIIFLFKVLFFIALEHWQDVVLHDLSCELWRDVVCLRGLLGLLVKKLGTMTNLLEI